MNADSYSEACCGPIVLPRVNGEPLTLGLLSIEDMDAVQRASIARAYKMHADSSRDTFPIGPNTAELHGRALAELAKFRPDPFDLINRDPFARGQLLWRAMKAAGATIAEAEALKLVKECEALALTVALLKASGFEVNSESDPTKKSPT